MKVSDEGVRALRWMATHSTARMWAHGKEHPQPFPGGFRRATLDALRRRRLAVCLQDRPLVLPEITEARCDIFAPTSAGLAWIAEHGAQHLRRQARAWFTRAA